MGRIIKFEKTKWPRSVFNPQKLLRPETSTSTPKLPSSPRQNLMPFPSRETASATKCYRLWSPSNHALFQSFSGIRFLTFVLYIYSGNNRFKKLKQNTQKKKKKKKKS